MDPQPVVISPPRARLAFRVGVVGHRPNHLQNANPAELSEVIRQILAAVKDSILAFAALPANKDLYSDGKPILRTVTPLAEGTDRLFAEQAITLDYELSCPMPFHQAEYEADFSTSRALEPDSLLRFRALLAKAKEKGGLTIFELDGDRQEEGVAYGAAGQVVLNQSDLLIAVWDGRKATGIGGTAETLHAAVRSGVPVIRIDSAAPHSWQLLGSEADLRCLIDGEGSCSPGTHDQSLPRPSIADIAERIVAKEISVPAVEDAHSDDWLTEADYLGERKPHLRVAILWKIFRDLVGSARLRVPSLKVADFETAISEDWPAGNENGNVTVGEWVNGKLRAHYAWADKMADLYADAYRSAYVFIYLFAAVAVFLALLPLGAGWRESDPGRRALCIASEFLILGAISLILLMEKRRSWHKRWIAYRMLAEIIRQLRCLIPLGGGGPLSRVPAHLAMYGDPTRTWMYWQVRAIARETGLPNAVVDGEYVAKCLDYMDSVVRGPTGNKGQLGFHSANMVRSKNIAHRLHMTAQWLFGVTLACICLHLLPEIWRIGGPTIILPPPAERWLTVACATLPAIAAALAGVNNQGEFARIAKRSRSMKDAFDHFAARIDAIREAGGKDPNSLRIATIEPLAAEITQLMVDEVIDWRVVFIDRPATAA